MAKRRSLARAPIAEAVVDFRARARRAIEDAKARLAPDLRSRYPQADEIRTLKAELAFRPGIPPVPRDVDEGLHGYVFKSADGKDLAQFRVDGFTVNRLHPYQGGDALLEETFRLWPLYLEVAAPRDIKRLALRYINRLEDLSPDEFRDLLVDPPHSPAGSPGSLDSFFTRVVTSDRTAGLTAVTTRKFERLPAGHHVLILDIDVSLDGDFRTEVSDLRPAFQKLRDLKNEVFFGTITEAAATRYEIA